jgi:hypothetical protein
MVRSLRELVDVDDPAWPALADALVDSGASTRILPIEPSEGERCLYRLQVTARSTLGALALKTGGVTVGHGWLRVLGGGGHGLRDLAGVNNLRGETHSESPGLMLVAFDVLGGRFAINGGMLPGQSGEVCYWGPDTMQWQPTGLGHTDFVHWSITDGLDKFYAELRWNGWEHEVAEVALDAGLSIYPFLCTAESRPIAATSRRPFPWDELSQLLDELAALPEGKYRFESGP